MNSGAGHPLVQLTLVRLREFIREPEAVFWTLLFPVLMTVGLGIAFRSRPPDVLKVATTSSTLAAALKQEPGLDAALVEAAEGRRRLSTGAIVMLAEPGPDGSITYRYDDTNPESRTARMLVDRAIQIAGGRKDPVPTTDELVREAGSRYVDFLVPGLVGLGIMTNTLWGLSFAIVDSRRRKLMKRLMATPMSRVHYLLSFLVWRLMVLGIEVVVPVAFGALVFGVPVRGSIILLAVISIAASLSFSAQALLVSSRVRTIEAASGLVNLLTVPTWILSGVFFSAERFPEAIQPLIALLPLTALIDALRAHMLQGAGFIDVAPQLAVLTGWLVVSFALAMRLFRWK